MSPIGSPHAGCVDRLNRILLGLLGDRATIAVQNPAVWDDWSESQPDVTVRRPCGQTDGLQPARPVVLLVALAPLDAAVAPTPRATVSSHRYTDSTRISQMVPASDSLPGNPRFSGW
jgi:hypothetical protein